jgi:hypothetical protein
MPFYWTIDSREHLVTIVAEGDVTPAEINAYLDMLDDTGFHSWRKLFNGVNGHSSMGSENALAIAARIRGSHSRFEIGPLAIVAQADKVEMFQRVVGVLAAADRSMRVFDDVDAARAWILTQPY